ncbi:hypothetical protein G6F42_015528 [Rhizopus arrhizus]|nr:hypothetical protein G6F42_015528 [Rhizopus arrhizus]
MTAVTDLSSINVLSPGLSKKIIKAQRQRAIDDAFKFIPKVLLYEYENLKHEVHNRNATTAILRQVLAPGSVLLAFRNKTFDQRTAVYRVIQEQISVNAEYSLFKSASSKTQWRSPG